MVCTCPTVCPCPTVCNRLIAKDDPPKSDHQRWYVYALWYVHARWYVHVLRYVHALQYAKEWLPKLPRWYVHALWYVHVRWYVHVLWYVHALKYSMQKTYSLRPFPKDGLPKMVCSCSMVCSCPMAWSCPTVCTCPMIKGSKAFVGKSDKVLSCPQVSEIGQRWRKDKDWYQETSIVDIMDIAIEDIMDIILPHIY